MDNIDDKKKNALLIVISYINDSNTKGVFTLDESHDIYISFDKLLSNCDNDGIALTHVLKVAEVSNMRQNSGRSLVDSFKLCEACRFLKTNNP